MSVLNTLSGASPPPTSVFARQSPFGGAFFKSAQNSPVEITQQQQQQGGLPAAGLPHSAARQPFFAAKGTADITPPFGLAAKTAFTAGAAPENVSGRIGVAAPVSVFATSVFQQSSKESDAFEVAQRSSHLGVPMSDGNNNNNNNNNNNSLNAVLSSSQGSRQIGMSAAPSSSVFPEKETAPHAFNPMASSAKRGRGRGRGGAGGNMIFGGRGAGRMNTALPPYDAPTVGAVWSPQPPQQQKPQPPKQQQKRPNVVIDEKEYFLSTRVFAAFLRGILSKDEVQREKAAGHLDDAFFGVVGSHGGGDFAVALEQMLAVWNTLKETQQESSMKGELWVSLFALGCHLNLVTRTIMDEKKESEVTNVTPPPPPAVGGGGGGDRNRGGSGCVQKVIILRNKRSCLTSSCTYANLLCDICLQLFSSQSENHVPYSILPFVFRRARNTFELANDEGIFIVQSNMKTILSKLHRHVRLHVLQQEPQSAMDECRTAAYACILGEMILHYCAPPGSDQFVQSFHQYCSSMIEIRCTLYHHYAHNLLQGSLTDDIIREAMELLSRAVVIVPDGAETNKHLLLLKLTACGLALGELPSQEDEELYKLSELQDVMDALKDSNLPLFDATMQQNADLYVQCGIHNVLQIVGKRIALLMIVKYYCVKNFSNHLPVQDMLDYYQMPYSLQEGCHVWLLPLLVEKRINGVMESGVLILSTANPFDEYNLEALHEMANRSQAA